MFIFVTSVHAQEVGANCGIDAFPTGGCVAPSSVEEDGGGDQAYFGIQFVVGSGDGMKPKIVAGIRSTEVSSEGRTSGADLAIRFAPGAGGFVFDSVVLSGLAGEDNMLGRLGVGYSNSHGGWLGSGAVEQGLVGVGVDYTWSAGVIEYFSEFSLRDQSSSSGASCPEGFNARDIDVEEPFGGEADDFFVLSTDLLLGETTCEPEEFRFDP
jgi:hypothetical protein